MSYAALYYEAHVTIDPLFGKDRETAEAIAQAFGFRLAKLYMDKGVPSQLDTFMTGHGRELTDIKTRMKNLIHCCVEHNFKVRRYKIEDTVLDSRIQDVLQLL